MHGICETFEYLAVESAHLFRRKHQVALEDQCMSIQVLWQTARIPGITSTGFGTRDLSHGCCGNEHGWRDFAFSLQPPLWEALCTLLQPYARSELSWWLHISGISEDLSHCVTISVCLLFRFLLSILISIVCFSCQRLNFFLLVLVLLDLNLMDAISRFE